MNEDKIAIVALCGGCNRIVLATSPDRLTRKDKNELGRLAASGHKIEHWKVEAVRAGDWCCECKGKK